MSPAATPLLADCSVVAKWKLASELHASQAGELLLDWQAGVIQVCASDQLFVELMNALLRACRAPSPRLTVDEAEAAHGEVSALPFAVFKTRGRRLLARALRIAHRHNQRGYDCVYVALAERKGIEFWTGDQRLYNALHSSFPFIRHIASYARKRP